MTVPISKTDPSSFSNNDEIKVLHVHLDLAVDFSTKKLHGSVLHSCSVVSEKANKIVFDTSFLNIKDIFLIDGEKSTELQYTLAKREGFLGSPLTVQLDHDFLKNEDVRIKINYETTDKCTAIQWLEPSQTVGKVHPYLFTQCQAIHARSMLPCQDTPNLKITYSANITCPPSFRALMSAIPSKEETVDEQKTYSFVQNTTIPSYLIALAVGNIEGKKVGPRTTVWSEPEVVEAAAWEFEGTETFIATGESLLTPYSWGIYDLLLLPASFPYGGMENPCLTFVTPSLLAGDRSLVDVVAHEIAHSWAGNLVTSANWEHFWLNEGFTVFIERKIVEKLHGKKASHFSAILGYYHLKESVDVMMENNTPNYTCLRPNLKGIDPDDVFSSVPYAHFVHFAHKSITTQNFKDYLYQFMESNYGKEKVDILNSVDWEGWFTDVGMPKEKNDFDQTLSNACKALALKWKDEKDLTVLSKLDPSDVTDFTPTQKMNFLDILNNYEKFEVEKIVLMKELYKFGEYKNMEILSRWQGLCLKAEYEPIFPAVVDFITKIGRMKYVRPLFRALYKCKNGKQLARETFLKHKSFYHPICQDAVTKDLEL
ncbi:hypothetical protein HK099_000041 [Clydaea vesicula]|uniref:Peptidase M1 leukotriene A4 hydrolase/aminopeptidase C-terminal domain-containing protein n=1 Tax=Clydaea vesicula TaxID=447962 RepID=A0AAD5U9M7_9FUNG|nr:hypothetical protein HK099_000041 [Clydaea vesicula]